MWELIDTAPKDGTRVLLFCPALEPKQCFGLYVDSEIFEYGVSQSSSRGWVLAGSTAGWATPTHWMPLTDPE